MLISVWGMGQPVLYIMERLRYSEFIIRPNRFLKPVRS